MQPSIIGRRMRVARPRRTGVSTRWRGITYALLCLNATRRGDRTAMIVGRDIVTVAHLVMVRES